MLNLDTLLSPLPYLLHPFLPATLLLANLLFTSPQSSASYTPKALSLWCSVAIILSLLNALNSYLVSVEALERDGLRALFDNSILGRRKSKSKRVVKWNEEIVLVTGGAGGLGREIVRLCVARGARGVAVVDVVGGRDVEDEQEQGTKTRVKGYVCDVGNAEEVQKLREMVARDLGGPPTILINNAGITNSKPLLELSSEDVERTFRVNTVSHFNTIRTFLPDMLTNDRGGSIVTVSSVLGYLGCAGLTDYTSSKAALLALHSSLLSELAFLSPQSPTKPNSPISLILATPGQLQTPLFAHLPPPPLARFAAPTVPPRDLAEKIVRAIESGEKDVRVSAPMYAGILAAGWWGVLPTGVARLCRGLVGLDAAGWGGVLERRKRDVKG